jgi:hypothetical protein
MTRRVANLIMSILVAMVTWAALAIVALLMWRYFRDYAG